MIKKCFQAVDNRQYRAMAFERGHKKKRSAVTPLIACRVFPGLIVGNGNPGKSSRSPRVWEMEMGAFEGPGSWS